ncbi:MAG: hypothetical protein V7700_16460, partial [Halioglobus sp.]
MDWDSKTTKKHIKEAEAQGCKLLGACNDAHYRLYALPCGHQQEAHTGAMRKGEIRCQICAAGKLRDEAETQGCKLIGAGRTTHYRLYVLSCGHEQEVMLRSMRDGGFGCGICLDEKLNQEAEAQGCKLVGEGKKAKYRVYALPCGHEQEMMLRNMREGSFRCRTCLTDKLNQEAKAQRCKLLGAGGDSDCRLYALPCGHEQEVSSAAMRRGGFRCRVCLANKLGDEAEAQGCKLLGAGKSRRTRLYVLSCGHEQEVSLGAMRDGVFRCGICLDEKLSQEAEAQGCELLGAGKS